jgi:ribosomal protein L16 Arg81 hydroxylase
MSKKSFPETFINEFFSKNFRKGYVHKKNFILKPQEIMSVEILTEMLSIRDYWNNKNFKMVLDRESINYADYSSLFLEHSTNILRPDVKKVQNLISRGSSLVLSEIEKLNSKLYDIVDELQNITNGKCQGNLYFSMESRQAFGPHCDDHDVFAIHFEGEKIWNIYENIETNPINHPIFKYDAKERENRAGKLIDQVTLQPGDLLYLPRGQYHDALASKNGAIHIAFGLTYFKPIDLLSLMWNKIVLNEYMREDFKINPTKDELSNHLKKLSIELSGIINDDENTILASEAIKNWPYKLNRYSLKQIMSKGKEYKVDKSIKIEKNGHETFLSNSKNKVLIPSHFVEIIDFILQYELIFHKDILNNFKELKKETVIECINSLEKMKVIQ